MIKKKLLRAFLCVLSCILLLTGCGKEAAHTTPGAFLLDINDLIVDDFGVLTETDALNAQTSVTKISDHITLTLLSDADTGFLVQTELALTRDADTAELDYSTFSYFFLILLKAYDKNISIANINTVHDTLLMETYETGTETQIGYGDSVLFYTVTEDMAIFTIRSTDDNAAETN